MLHHFRVHAIRPLRTLKLETTALLLVLAAALPVQAQAKASCKNIPVSATFSPIPGADQTTGATPNGGLFGHTATAFTTYTNGVSGTVVLLACNGTGDFYLNLPSSEYFTYDFSKGLVQGDVLLLPTGTRLTGWVIKVNQVGNLAHYTNETGVLGGTGSGELGTLLESTLYANKYLADYVLSCDESTQNCSGTRQALADKYSDTSPIRVTVAPNCAYWTIEPVLLSVAGDSYPVAGLIDQTSARGNATLVSGGQYSMPFTITLTRTDGISGCSGLLQ